jgi:hypothetical protein
MDVGCVRITATSGSQTAERNLDVQVGQAVETVFGQLPVGAVQFNASAFGGACSAVPPGATASWVADPVTVQLKAGLTAIVQLVLRQNGHTVVNVVFQTNPATGAPCVGDQPGCFTMADSFGPGTAAPPDGARILDLVEFGQRMTAGILQPVSARLSQAAGAQLDAQAAADLATVQQGLAGSPDLLARALQMPVEDSHLALQGDGNYQLTITDSTGTTRQVITMGQRFKLAELAGSLRTFRTQPNQLAIYSAFFPQLPADYAASHQLPPPDRLANAPADQIYELNLGLVNDSALLGALATNLDLPPPGRPATCAAEIGTPAMSHDETGACTPSPTGIWQNTAFPLKWYTTCVKDQGYRGTCTAFGITSSIEAKYAMNHNKWTNLSEEEAYFFATVPRQCGDGLWPFPTLNSMIGSGFTYPYESDWDYNPTNSRPYNACPYVDSCVGYSGRHCSDTTHQGDIWCFVDPISVQWYCATDGSAPASSGVQPNFAGNLWFPTTPSGSVAWGVLALALKGSLVLSMDVTAGFEQGAANGVATFNGPGEKSEGGHSLHVVGFVDNAHLPSGTPPGSGGGYYIVKNSWGRCWGDAGYVYLPWDLVATYASSLTNVGTN